MTPAHDDEGTTRASATGPEAEDPWGDDLWGDEGDDSRHTQIYMQVGLVVIIVAILAAVVILRSDSDDTDTAQPRASTPATAGSATSEDAPAVTSGGGGQPTGPAWPTEVNGRPAAFGELEGAPDDAPGGAEPGVYIWNDFDGWHLWVVNGDGVSGVSGQITGNDAIAGAEVVPEDAGTATPADNQITFDLSGEPEIVGINFNPGFYANSLVISIDGETGPVPAELMHLGQNLAPAENPAVIVQTPGA